MKAEHWSRRITDGNMAMKASSCLEKDFNSNEWVSALQTLNINNCKQEGCDRVSPSLAAASPNCGDESRNKSDPDGVSSEELVLHKLSRINGIVNKMTKEELQEHLDSLGLNTSGVKDVLKKRLKNYHKRQKTSQSKRLQQAEEKTSFSRLVVIDYEATCARSNDNFVHEIIEFPAVIIDVQSCAVTAVFQRFCKPRVNPRLTTFCTELTGITQAQVDAAKDFTEVFQEFQDWLKTQGLGKEHKFAIVTDGPWDMARFLRTQVELSGLKFPPWAKHWINLRKSYSNFYDVGRVTLQGMLDDLGMVFEGRPHSGLDDSRNIAAIAIRLLSDGCVFKNNEQLHQHNHQNNHQSSSFPKPCSRPANPHRKGRLLPAGEEVTQEGDNLDDLLLFARLQKS